MRSYGGSPRTGLGLEVEPTDRRQGSHRLPGQNFANGDTRTLATSSTASSPTALSGNPGLGATTAVDPPAPMSTFTPPPQVPMPMQPGWPMQPQPVLFSYPVHYAPMLPSHGGGVIAPPPLPMALGDTNSGPTNMAPRMWTPIMYGHMASTGLDVNEAYPLMYFVESTAICIISLDGHTPDTASCFCRGSGPGARAHVRGCSWTASVPDADDGTALPDAGGTSSAWDAHARRSADARSASSAVRALPSRYSTHDRSFDACSWDRTAGHYWVTYRRPAPVGR